MNACMHASALLTFTLSSRSREWYCSQWAGLSNSFNIIKIPNIRSPTTSRQPLPETQVPLVYGKLTKLTTKIFYVTYYVSW